MRNFTNSQSGLNALLPDKEETEMEDFNLGINYNEERHKTTFTQVLIHLFKSNFGVGILSMPQAMLRGGLLLGPLLSILFLIPIIHCMFLLLKCSREQKRRSGKSTIGYAGTFRYSLIPYINLKARFTVYLVNIFIITSQLGFCSVYFVFTADTLQKISGNYFQDKRVLIAILMCIVLLPSLVSRLDIMAILSGAACLCCSVGLIITMVFVGMNIKSVSEYPLAGELQNIPLFLSTLMYVFEGVNTVIPLDNEIDDPSRYPLALKIATIGSASSYFLVGILGYLAYGSNTESSITLNIPVSTFTNTVRVIYALGIILSYFIQFYVAMSVIIPTFLKKTVNPKAKILYSCLIRAFFVILTALFAIAVPQLDNIINFIGALSCTSLSLIFPCIIHMATYWVSFDNGPTITLLEMIKDILIIMVGITLCGTGLYTTINKIIEDYHK